MWGERAGETEDCEEPGERGEESGLAGGGRRRGELTVEEGRTVVDATIFIFCEKRINFIPNNLAIAL